MLPTIPNFVLGLGPLALILVGFTVLWANSLWLRQRRNPWAPWLGSLRVVGWVLLLVGLFSFVGLIWNVAFLIGWLATAVALLSVLCRDRNLELRALLWNLMVAAERGIPLEAAARTFADEQTGRARTRALDLADYLEAGLPLSLALRRSRHRVPPAVSLAADLGQQTNQLGPALRKALTRSDDFEVILRTTTEKLFYLAFLSVFGLGIWIFVLIKIMPVFEKLLRDFGISVPSATKLVLNVSEFAVVWWPGLAMLCLLALAFVISGLLYYAGWSPRVLPGLSWLWWRADCAVVLRWLAVAVKQNRPLGEMVRLLAGYFPQRHLGRRLEWSAKRIEHGADWSDCLRQAGVIRRPERAVFQAAERVGNLAWALEEMADSSVRRSAYRLQAFTSVAFPVLVAVFGGGIFLMAAGVLLPLFVMIQKLT